MNNTIIGPATGGRKPHRGTNPPHRNKPTHHESKPTWSKLTQRGFLQWGIPRPNQDDVLGEQLLPMVRMKDAPAEERTRFAEVGRRVEEAKKKLDSIPPKEFDKLSRALDLYGPLKGKLRSMYNMSSPTNAALKMYELIIQMRLLVCESGPPTRIRAFCNAELPGAFIVAINHYMKTMCPATDFDWVGSSYYPEEAAARGDVTILGDMYGLYENNRDRWLMGPPPNALPAGENPLSGDLTNANVVAALADAVHTRFGGATLYTSDAGIDVSADFNRQEELTSLLNFGQVLCGLLSLAPGGHLVTKQYTFITPFSRSLIALVATFFDETYIVKPLTSRPANSEVYVVGKGFTGIDSTLANALLDRLAEYRTAPSNTTPCDWTPLLDPTMTSDVDAALLRIARQLHEQQQVDFLNEAAGLFQQWEGRLDQLGHLLKHDAQRVQDAWLANNPVRRIRDDQQLQSKGSNKKISTGQSGEHLEMAARGGQ